MGYFLEVLERYIWLIPVLIFFLQQEIVIMSSWQDITAVWLNNNYYRVSNILIFSS